MKVRVRLKHPLYQIRTNALSHVCIHAPPSRVKHIHVRVQYYTLTPWPSESYIKDTYEYDDDGGKAQGEVSKLKSSREYEGDGNPCYNHLDSTLDK